MKDIYKTVWEIKMKSVIDLAADRGAFVDQSQVRFVTRLSISLFPPPSRADPLKHL